MKILLLGGSGFIGSNIKKQRPGWEWTVVHSKNYDLTDIQQVNKIEGDFDIIINSAGYFGGIVFNQSNPREILYKNQIMSMNICRLVDRLKPRKFVSIGSACLYPVSDAPLITESMIGSSDNYHPSVVYSAITKYWLLKTMQTMQVDWEYLILSNVYGPGEHLSVDRSHFVGSLINKIKNSKHTVELLGTGVSVRDFLYITDAAEAVCRYCELDNATNLPTNIGTGKGTQISHMANVLISNVNPDLILKWGGNLKDNGVLHKVLDNSKMFKDIGYTPTTTIETGLQQTWDWFKNNE